MTSRLQSPYILTAEQLALSRQRKAKRAALQAQKSDPPPSYPFFRRNWLQVPTPPLATPPNFNVRVLTFNVLAQTLVRRELFPTSGDILRQKDRFPLLCEELFSDPKVDVICLQEVDTLQKLAPIMDSYGFDYVYTSGHGKKHGCLIAFKQALYKPLSQRTIYYDEHSLVNSRSGLSFKTNNVGLLLAFQSQCNSSVGFIVATTHLFWHPKYAYERARQAMILLRETHQFRAQNGSDWPFIITGDFNCSPEDAAYSLLIGNPLTTAQKQDLQESRIIHVSADSSPTVTSDKKIGAEEEQDPDVVITNARPANPQDGLYSDEELSSISTEFGPCRSAYDQGMRLIPDTSPFQLFKDRFSTPELKLGGFEPAYTSYAHLWKATIDYIFVDASGDRYITGLLEPHKSTTLEPGLPQQGVGGSDHCSISADISW